MDDLDRPGRDVPWSGPPHGGEGWSRWLVLADRARSEPRLQLGLVVAVLAVVGLGYVAFAWLQPPTAPRAEDILPRVGLTPSSAPTTTVAPTVLVHVVGAVVSPGLRELPGGARVADAVTAAGGPTPEADLARVNLAAPAVDGSQIRVPAVGEAATGPSVVGPDGSSTSSASGGSGGGGVVDLNTADASALEELPGVGPATAEAILAWREDNGPFTTVDQLLEVRGIGPAKFEALEDLVVVG